MGFTLFTDDVNDAPVDFPTVKLARAAREFVRIAKALRSPFQEISMMSPPELACSQWFNTPEPLSLAGLKGRVIALHAFQMLCPGCVAHGAPQAQRLHRLFSDKGLSVVGLHTVFEHHDAMTPVSLAAFIHEYRLSFPIGVDEAGQGTPIPVTMERYGMRGTPTLIVIDRRGRQRAHLFGQIDDLSLGALIGSLLAESADAAPAHEDDAGRLESESIGCSRP